LRDFYLERSCLISKNKEYRWSLSFLLSQSKKEIIFIGLNPSLSDSVFIDNTTKKIIKICKNHNYGKVKILNLFALISKSPNKLLIHKDPVGKLNNSFINKNLRHWSEKKNCHLWIGWGNKGTFFNRNKEVSKMILDFYLIKKINFDSPIKPLFIKKTKQQNPIHPLYCSGDSSLQYASLKNNYDEKIC